MPLPSWQDQAFLSCSWAALSRGLFPAVGAVFVLLPVAAVTVCDSLSSRTLSHALGAEDYLVPLYDQHSLISLILRAFSLVALFKIPLREQYKISQRNKLLEVIIRHALSFL